MQWFQIFRQAGLVLSAIAMANGLLTQDEIGNFELLLFLGFSLSFFWVDGLIKTYLMEYQTSENRGQLVFQIYFILVGIALLLMFVLWVGEKSLIPGILGQNRIDYLLLYALYLFFMLPSNLLSVHLMLVDRLRSLIIVGGVMLIGPVLIVLVSTGIYHQLQWMYYGFVIYGFFMHLFLLISIVPGWKRSFDTSLIQEILSLAWPLMVYAIAVSMARIFDGWLVSWYYQDESTFALFRYGAREFPLTVALATGVTTAFVPLLQKEISGGLADLKIRTTRLMHLLFPLSALLILISPWAFELVFTSSFVQSADIFNIYLLLVLSQLLFPHAIILAYKENQTILRASLVELVINIILSVILIRYWHLEGVAVATVAAYMVEKLIYISYLNRKYNIRSSSYIPWKVYSIYAFLLVVTFVISRFIIWV
jgi:O-antigen/teichoic acid export membrane protein